MTSKGLDTAFVHYGIRRDDLDILESLALKHNLDYSWIQEQILRPYHEQKTKDELPEEKLLIKLIEKALHALEIK
jgi:hypothetical protein